MPKPKILILEDQEMMRNNYVEMLTFFGYSVVAVKDGVEGVQAVKEADAQGQPFNLFFSDVQMPRMSGPQFFQTVSPGRSTPIIYQTGGMKPREEKMALAQLPTALLSKYEAMETIKEAIQQALRNAEQSQQSKKPSLAELVTNDFQI